MSRKQFPRHVRLAEEKLITDFQDPVSLGLLYQPITIKGSDPRHTFSAPIIDELTKTSKVDPLNQSPLEKDWKVYDFELDKKITEALASIPLTYGGN